MKRARIPFTILLPLTAALLAMVAPPVLADVDGDVRAGYYVDTEEPMIGGGILTGLGDSWYFNPNIELVLVDGGDLATINADFHYDFHLDGGWSWWLGAGPALVYADPDGGDDDLDPGANLLIGIGAVRGKVRPYAQGKVLISDDSEAVVSFGIRF